ncbi:hypothetical protein AYI69_g3447 [Smittium culicis]|uniref:Uncharacterized protein n=1 Tax=Smittium culicis TaxID=133412 RepID=A0A1R1YJN5_9FUNG|nr:hypothetical protein AYI69_g3447 [Smittium culicis]
MFKNTLGFVFVFICALMFSNASNFVSRHNSANFSFFSTSDYTNPFINARVKKGICYNVGWFRSAKFVTSVPGTVSVFYSRGCVGKSMTYNTPLDSYVSDTKSDLGLFAYSFMFN